MFARVHQNLTEHKSFRATIEGTRRPQAARTPVFEEDVWTEVSSPVYWHLPLQPEGLEPNISPSCTAGQSLTSVLCAQSVVVTAR